MKREKKTVEQDANRPLKVGDAVLLVNVGVKGTVLKEENKDGNVFVQAGIMKMNVPANELQRIEQPKKKQTKAQRMSSGVKEVRRSSAKSELDLRGMMVDEALMELDRYISDCLMARLDVVTIIHGKGTGALRAAVQDHLRHEKHVRSIRGGRYGEGDSGVTIVEFK